MSAADAPAIARAAEALVGTPFRLHGREPQRGLDCVGVVVCALAGAGRVTDAPMRYRIRNANLPDLAGVAARAGLASACGAIAPGDIVLVRPGPAQIHLMIAACTGGFVHAHAGLRQVVLTPGAPQWPIVHHWRASAKG